MKKKKRILRTVISTVLLCCMLVGDIGSVFATSVDNTEIISEEVENKGTEQDVQTLSEPIEAPEVDIPAEQPTEGLVQEPIEEPKVEVETPVVEEEIPPTEEPQVEETPVEKPQEEQPSEETQVEPPVGDATVEEPSTGEVTPTESDNWSLDLVFYDSSVDDGKTPLKSIDWDASDGGYGDGESRTITVQINYKNTNAVRTYQPGELELSIPNLIYNTTRKEESSPFWNSSVIVGANDSSHTGYDWNFSTASTPSNTQQTYNFTNAVEIEEKTNFEGSIQIVYTITPEQDLIHVGDSSECKDQYKEECSHSYSLNLQAKLKDIVETNTLNFSYTRTYIHPWTRTTIFTKTASKITSFDGLPSNHNDYIWVIYNFSVKIPYRGYPNVAPVDYKGIQLRDTFPEECIVMETGGKIVENEYIKIIGTVTSSSSYIIADKKLYVGYPKSIYNEENKNLNITNSADIYVHWANGTEFEYAKTSTVNVNLADFNFTYTGNLYGIQKGTLVSSDTELIYQDIQKEMSNNQIRWLSRVKTRYTGQPMTVKIGDDILYATNKDGNPEKLTDEDYYFSVISFPVSGFKNGNNVVIPKGKYNCELWVRYAGNTEYTLYDEFTNGNPGSKNSVSTDLSLSYAFSKSDKIVGFYFLIKDMTEGIGGDSGVVFDHYMRFIKKDIPQSGRIHNFNYLQVYFKDADGNLVLQNEPELSSYNSFLSKEEIAKFDQETYGTYLQRATSYANWSYKDAGLTTSLGAYKKAQTNIIQDAENEKFIGKFDIGISLDVCLYYEKYADQYIPNKDNALCGFVLYDLLPEGMELESTKEEIVNSATIPYDRWSKGSFYDFELKSLSNEEVRNIIRNNSTVNIYKNWRNTGRTKIEIIADFKDTPIYLLLKENEYTSGSNYFCYTYKYSVPYNSFLEYGNIWENRVYTEFTEQPMSENKKLKWGSIDDNGTYDISASDINENNKTDDKICTVKDTATITSVVSTHQDVQTTVQTDKSIYSTGLVKASPESEYYYKLRARSGSNQVSNLVLVNNLEEGYGSNEHWKGDFLGIDTSFAENRTYRVYKPSDSRADAEGYVQEKVKVKPYYSTSTTEGELYQTEEKVTTDPSGEQIVQKVRVVDEQGNFVKNSNWLEYSDSVDKSTVKSLAFEFLDAETSEQAILPENNLIYVEIKMKAPVEADGLTEDGKAKYAYNNCFTQWNALDNMGQTVDFITGINSNTVKVTVNDKVSVQINKVWDDENNKYNTRPDTVEFVMKKDGTEVSRQTLKKGEDFVTFGGLLAEELSTYTFEEVCPEGYKTDGVIYDKVSDTYTATNVLNPNSLIEIKGTKTWVGGLDSEMPESITINLYRDDVKIDSKVVRASDGWKYDFGKFIKTNSNGTEYKYRVEEEPVEGWISTYAAVEGGLNIKFSENSRTESSSLDYVEIYYPGGDGKIYKLPKIGGSSIAGKVVGVPSKNFWLYWRTDSSNSNYYGFSIDSIESASVGNTGTIATLPNYDIEYLSGGNYPDSAFDGHTHSNYGNNVNKIWHYGTNMNRFDINNISNKVNIEGTKRWEGDTPEMRPESITVNLLQNGKQFMSTTTDASKGWKYSFRVPEIDTDTYKKYVYSVREEPVDGYSTTYSGGNGCKITFSADSKTESMSYDYLEVYYAIGNYFYKAGTFGGNTISGASITLPSRHFFLHWKTDGSGNNYYGYRVESIEDVEFDTIIGDKATLPIDPDIRIEYSNELDFFQSEHSPYKNNDNSWKAYMSMVGKYDILNTANITTISGTKHWVGDTEDTRPESITVNLLQDGKQIDSVNTDASKGWKYSFTAPKFDDTGRDYDYSVSEEPVNDYKTSYIKNWGSRIHFSNLSRTENKELDYVKIYYEFDGKLYSTGKLGGTNISGQTVDIPSKDFWVYWKTDSSNSNYYGYKINLIEGIPISSVPENAITETDLPNSLIMETSNIGDLQSYHNPYDNSIEELWWYKENSNYSLYDIVNIFDNIELRFKKEFNCGVSDHNRMYKHSGISFSLYENTLKEGYPKSYPGTSDEWVKVGDLSKNEIGGNYADKFDIEYYISGLKSNKEYFLVENINNPTISYYEVLGQSGKPDAPVKDYSVDINSIEDSCYVVKTGEGNISELYLTVYGYSESGYYAPEKIDDWYNFCTNYGGYTDGTNLHKYLEYTSRKYPAIEPWDLLYSVFPYCNSRSEWVIPNFLETKRISVTKKIKASDINFDNGNPTFIFEARVPDAFRSSTKSVESELLNYPVLDIKHVEFTKEYVEANTDSKGYVSKTVYFDRIEPFSSVVVAERVGSRYDCSSVTVDGLNLASGIDKGIGAVVTVFNPFIETNITFTNEKYENQYYSHNDIVVNEIKRNKTSELIED